MNSTRAIQGIPFETFQFVCNDEEIFPLDPRSNAFHYSDPKWRHKSETILDFLIICEFQQVIWKHLQKYL